MTDKKENSELHSHLHEEDKVELPASRKPVDSHDVTGVKPLLESDRWDQSNNNGESEFRESENRSLDSVLEYANRIRAFVGFEGDDVQELPPPPLPKPLIIDNIAGAVDESLTVEDIDRELEIIDNPSALGASQDRDLSTDEPLRNEENIALNPESDVPLDTSGDQNFNVRETENTVNSGSNLSAPDDQHNNINDLVNSEADLCARNDSLCDQNNNINIDGDSNVKNPDKSFPVTSRSADSEPGPLENTNREFVDEMSKTSLLRNSDENIEKIAANNHDYANHNSVELKNSTSDPSIPSKMINNGYIDDDGKELADDKNTSNEVQSEQVTDEKDLPVTNKKTETNNSKEKTSKIESFNGKLNHGTDFQTEGVQVSASKKDMKGVENAGFENDVREYPNNETDITKHENADSSTQICNDNSALPGHQSDNQLLNDIVSGKTSEVFLFDPEYVEELQKESEPMEDEVKPTPDMAVLRRLSMDVVNKVLDDAGNQIREILDERKRSNIEINNLVSNAEELMCNTLSDENTSGKDQNNFDLSETADIRDENGTLPAYEEEKSHKSEKKCNQNEIKLKDVLAKTYDSHDFQRKIETEMNKFDSRYDVDPDTVCGIGSFKPKWIQPYATGRTYLVLYSIVGMLSGSYYTYLIGTISTLEKRFAFKSKVSGSIMMVDEITPLLLGVLIGYFGGKAHRPRMVGLGMLLSAICCFVSALPYFIYGPATHLNVLNVKNETSIGMCDIEPIQEHCDSDDRPPTLAAILFLMLGSFLKGFGNLAYYAVGLAYMDDNSKKRDTPIYFAVTMSIRLLGPIMGFLLSSACLKTYENPFVDPGFGPEDPRWIGGWWMGFLLQGFLLFIFAIPITLFPRKLPGHRNPLESETVNQLPNFTGLIAALKRLGKNPLFVFLTLNTIVTVFGAFGHYIMLPKYMENQFYLSASDASLFSGPPGLAAVMASTIVGGYLIWKFRPSPKVLTAGMLTVEVISALGFLILMIPQCERIQMTNFGLSDEGLILNNACNVNCNCTTSAFTPVCGPDGKTTYFSPCYAGCSESSNKTYSNCSCVSDSIEEQIVTEGYCISEGCWSKAFSFILILPILQMIVSLMRVSHTMVLLRSIEPADKSIALGTFETFLCAFAFIPFPIVYGAIVDSTCLVWESSCGKTGNCWFYDVDKFNYLLHGSSAGFSLISVFCLIAIFLLSGRVNDMYEDDDVTKDAKEQDHPASSETKM